MAQLRIRCWTTLALAAATFAAASVAMAQMDTGCTPRDCSPQKLFQRFYTSATRVKSASGHDVAFVTAQNMSATTAGPAAEAAERAADAMVDLASRTGGRQLIARIDGVRVWLGESPRVSVGGGEVDVVVTPTEGASGVPTAQAIEDAVVAGAARAT